MASRLRSTSGRRRWWSWKPRRLGPRAAKRSWKLPSRQGQKNLEALNQQRQSLQQRQQLLQRLVERTSTADSLARLPR